MKAALLVIDLQRGAFDGQRCPPIDSPQPLLHNASRLIAAAREAQCPVVFVQHCEGAGEPFEEGSEHGQLHPSLVPASGETVLKKYQSSSFEGTDLHDRLQAEAVTRLVLCGLQSEFCVSNTARSAMGLGYEVHVASDGHGTWPSAGKSAADIAADVNLKLAAAGVFVASTAESALALRG